VQPAIIRPAVKLALVHARQQSLIDGTQFSGIEYSAYAAHIFNISVLNQGNHEIRFQFFRYCPYKNTVSPQRRKGRRDIL
jgi:hypothetical protein